MSGFGAGDYDKLDGIFHTVKGEFTYVTDTEQYKIEDYWEDDAVLASSVKGHAKFRADCEAWAMVCMRKAHAAGFNARLVVCMDETKTGHCICEVESQDAQQAYYFDNRRIGVASRQALVDYMFYSVSPWNPEPGETRPWQRVTL